MLYCLCVYYVHLLIYLFIVLILIRIIDVIIVSFASLFSSHDRLHLSLQFRIITAVK